MMATCGDKENALLGSPVEKRRDNGQYVPGIEAVKADLTRHAAAYPEIIVTSAQKGTGIDLLRAVIAGLA